MRAALRHVAAVLGVAYPLALIVVVLLLRFVGERWWIALVVMYLPRWGFALPLPVVVAALWRWGPRRLVVLQLASVALVLFPLMGLTLNFERAEGKDGPLRVLSYNVWSGRLDGAAILRQIDALAPNMVVLQEAAGPRAQPLRDHFAGWHTSFIDQFFLASRFPIVDVTPPPKLPPPPVARSARFVRYTLATPLGAIDLINMHPISPREGLDELRGEEGFSNEVASGRIFHTRAAAHIRPNSSLRWQQADAVAAAVRASQRPVIVAGDTNLPTLSRAFVETLGGLQDGFTVIGRGFGYSFPSNHPWMRIDRIMASAHLRFTRFQTGDGRGSDHLCVFATLADAAGAPRP
jgi:endonuclease/exonuclease/phosphatase family metal-dependent hydrolase